MTTSRRFGFTFIEILVVFGILSVLVMPFASFMWNIVDINFKRSMMTQVTTESRVLSEQIAWLIRNAEDASVVSGDRLVLEQLGSSDTIEVFLMDGALYLDRGSGEEALTGSDIRVTSAVFQVFFSDNELATSVGYDITLESDRLTAESTPFFRTATSIRGTALIRSFPIP